VKFPLRHAGAGYREFRLAGAHRRAAAAVVELASQIPYQVEAVETQVEAVETKVRPHRTSSFPHSLNHPLNIEGRKLGCQILLHLSSTYTTPVLNIHLVPPERETLSTSGRRRLIVVRVAEPMDISPMNNSLPRCRQSLP
jgi:hypothetical protein